jgi:hypothetical protein
MQDFALTFANESEAIAALPQYRATTEDGEQWTGPIIANATRWIQRPAYDEDGNVTVPAEKVPGWHCIVRAETSPSPEHHVPDPGDIEPVFAGGWKHPIVPQSVKALQGMRAIKHAGLIPLFVPWKAALDPIADFEIIAFLEKAENWNYNDPIIDEALTSFGEIERKDELFLLAATL